MPIDFSKPVKTDNYDTGLLASIRAHVAALAMMLDPTDAGTVTSPPTGARRFNAGTGVLERFNGSAWVEQSTAYIKSSALAAYAPLTGAGASGTWGINISGTAAGVPWSGVTSPPAITGLTASTGTGANTVAQRDGSGYLSAVYFNQTGPLEAVSVGAVFVQNTAADGYLRKISLANFNAAISPAWANVSGRPTALSAFSNDTGFITSSALSGYVTSSSLSTTLGSYVTSSGLTTTLGSYAALGSGPTFSGQVRGNGGTKGLGAITVTTTTGTPTGGSDGDLVLVY